MATIKPYRALRPRKEFAAQVASKPYDVLNSAEAKEEVADQPLSFLRITKSEVDMPDSIDIHSTEVYNKAKENLQIFRDDGILFLEDKPCYYIYALEMNGRRQTGLACVSAVDDYFNNVIKKHEFTRPEKEQDRIDHITATKAQTGKVFLAYNNVVEIDILINDWKANHPPEYNFTADDGVQHTVWVIYNDDAIETITSLFAEKVPATYIADGHHRAASAAKASEEFSDSEDAKYFLTVIFPAGELSIMDYNRLVKDLNRQTEEDFLSALQENFEVHQSVIPLKPSQPHEFGMYLSNKWYCLRAKDNIHRTDPIGVLDVSILTNNILDPLLGIKDQRTDNRIDFVGGIRGLDELVRRVDNGEMKVAFTVYPVTIQQLFNIADSGNVMPPKSTWFEPKLRDGLLTHVLKID